MVGRIKIGCEYVKRESRECHRQRDETVLDQRFARYDLSFHDSLSSAWRNLGSDVFSSSQMSKNSSPNSTNNQYVALLLLDHLLHLDANLGLRPASNPLAPAGCRIVRLPIKLFPVSTYGTELRLRFNEGLGLVVVAKERR